MSSVKRILQRSVPNIRFANDVKRGLGSIAQFNAGLCITVNTVSLSNAADYFATTSRSIDIPALKINGLTDQAVVASLLAVVATLDNPPLKPSQPERRFVRVPKDELTMSCAHCRRNLWLLTADPQSHEATRAICSACGNTIRLNIRTFHAGGHA